MSIADFRTVGFFPLQDHVSVVGIGRRQMIAGARIVKMTDAGGNASEIMTEYGTDNGMGTLGDIHPWMFWQVRSREQRAMGSWAQSFAAVYSGALAGGSGPTTGDRPPAAFPMFGGWEADERYIGKDPARPRNFSTPVKGSTLIVMPAMNEHEQVEMQIPADGRLWAPQVSGPGSAGTLVCDLQPDATACMDDSEEPGIGGRHARLQSMMRVIAMPPYASAGLLNTGGNGIAWNLAGSQQDEIAGYGMTWCKLIKSPIQGPTTGGPGNGTSGPITPGHGTTGSSLLADGGTDTGNGIEKSGHFVERPQAGYGVALMASSGGYGPLHGGDLADKHHFGEDRDGNPINAGHVSVDAYFFRDVKRDAPLHFEDDYPDPPPLPLTSRVHLSYDDKMQHSFADGARQGMWRWWCEVPIVTPEDKPNYPPGGGSPPVPGAPPPGGPTPPVPGGPGAPGVPTPPPPTGGGGPGDSIPGPGAGGPTTPNPANPLWPGGRRFPGYPITGGGPAGPIAGPPSGPAPGYGPGEPKDPNGPSGPITGGGPSGPIAPLPSGPAPGYGPGESRFPGYAPVRSIPGLTNPTTGGRIAPGEKRVIGSNSPEDRRLYLLHHPMMESYGAMAFRPQLWVAGYANFDHGPGLGGELMRNEEEFRPQVLALRSWGAQAGDGLWDYRQNEDQSRARGGATDGGIFYCPPEFEPEDYFDLGDAKDVFAPSTQSFVTVAPGVAFALGTPVLDGGLSAASVTIAQTVGTNQALDISQLDATRVPVQLVGAELDQATGEVVVGIGMGGTQAARIPRGTTAQRPSALAPVGGEVRINSSGSADVLEWWDEINSVWVQSGSGGGGGGVTDHGALTGLADNDHPQYVLVTSIGTTVQAYNANLAAFAGLTSAADTLPYFTGSGTAALASFTATGRSIVAAASVSAALQVLGGGAAATGSGAVVLKTSPTLTTPNLGTPSALTLTNATGLPTAGLVNDAVTYAKIQNVSATDKVLGRSTAGAGDVEEIDCTATGRSIIAAASTQAAIDAITDAGGGEVAGAVWTSDGTNGSWSASAASVDQSEVLIRDRDDFLLGTVGWSVSTSGSGATCSAATDHVNSTENAVGEVSMGTGTTSTGRGGLYGAPGGILFGSSGAWVLNMRATCSPYAAGETFVFWIGFGDGVAGSGQPVDGAYFVHRYDTDGDHWVCVTRSNSTETKTVTSSAPAYATLDLFRIEVNEAGTSVSFYINGGLEAIHTTNIPTGSGRQFGIGAKIEKTASTTGKFGYVDYIEWTMTRSTAR